jgi:hypothetical protein
MFLSGILQDEMDSHALALNNKQGNFNASVSLFVKIIFLSLRFVSGSDILVDGLV